MFGGSDNDRLEGGSGNDELFGESGADKLFGGKGADSLEGGTGNDTLNGGDGADRFIFRSDSGNEGRDTIVGFVVAQTRFCWTTTPPATPPSA